jgi:hypothetical protein
VGLAASQGARLTVHVSHLIQLDKTQPTHFRVTEGEWALHATVFQQPGRLLTLPAPGSIDDTQYALTYVRMSSHLLQLHVKVSGGAVKIWNTNLPARGDERAQFLSSYYRAVLVAPDGTDSDIRAGEFGGDHISASYVITGPGTYHLRIGRPETGVYDAPILVPAG